MASNPLYLDTEVVAPRPSAAAFVRRHWIAFGLAGGGIVALALGLTVGIIMGTRDPHYCDCVLESPRARTTIQTECGMVSGVLDSATNVTIYKGIPFAAPPVGVRRWSAPVSLKDAGLCWSGVFNASTYGSRCPQFAPGLVFDATGDEDCLFLNVYVPPVENPEDLPVMFFIHGGYAMWFWSDVYDWSTFARETGSIVVTTNYRLHVLGFLALSELSARHPRNVSGNYAVQDLHLALRWVQSNIRAFGGNPGQVTISGQSSGGTLVLALLSSPASQGLFSAAISMSASPNNSMTLDDAMMFNRDFVNKSGCHVQPNVTACLFNLTTAEVRAAVPDWYYGPMLIPAWCCGIPEEPPPGPQWPALILVDGVTVVNATKDALATPVIDVPLMIGNMAQEADFAPAQFYTGLNLVEVKSRINTSLAAWHNATVVDVVFEEYRRELSGDPQRAFTTLASDLSVICGNLYIARRAASGFRNPVYSFIVTQGPAHPQYVFTTGYNTTAAYHMFDLLVSTHNWNAMTQFVGNPDYQPEAGDFAFGSFLRSLWLEFMTTGRVNGWTPAEPNFATLSVALLNGTITNVFGHKNQTCSRLYEYGFDQRYWWSS